MVLLWDENDYSIAPVTNRVMTVVDTNYGFRALQSGNFYTHFSLLKTIEGGLGVGMPQSCLRQQHRGHERPVWCSAVGDQLFQEVGGCGNTRSPFSWTEIYFFRMGLYPSPISRPRVISASLISENGPTCT